MLSDAQKEAGNYQKDRLRLHGLPITVENRKGTVRSGKDRHGNPWSVVMPYSYGYIRRTLGADGDHVDVFIGPNHASQFVVIVNQHERQTGKFEEVKVGLGYNSLEQAKAAYRQGYRGRNVPRATFKTTTVQRLKEWLKLKQTWAGFDLSAKSERLTVLNSHMKRVIMFRRAEKEEKPSIARRIASVAAPIAIIGGTLAYRHHTRPSVPTRAINPATPPARLRTEVRQPVIGDVANPRTTRWVTQAEHAGKAPAPKDSIFYEKAAPRSAAVITPGAPAKPKAIKKAVKPQAKTGRKLSLGAEKVLRLINFNNPNSAYDNLYGASDRIATAYRTGRRIVPWVKRGGQVAEDSADIASGKKVKDPFYKKAWFKAGVTGAAIAAPILAARKINAWHQQDKAFPNSVSAMSPKTGHLKEKVLKAARSIDKKWVAKNPTKRRPLLTSDDGPFFASKIKNPILLQAVLRHVELRADVASVLREYPSIREIVQQDAVDAKKAHPEIARKLGSNVRHATSYGEVTREAKRQGIGFLKRNAIAIQSRGAVWSGANAAFVNDGKDGLVITSKKINPKVLKHEIGHAIDYKNVGGKDGWKKEYGGVGTRLLGKFSKKHYVKSTLLPEHRAWDASGVDERDPVRKTALRSYAHAGPRHMFARGDQAIKAINAYGLKTGNADGAKLQLRIAGDRIRKTPESIRRWGSPNVAEYRSGLASELLLRRRGGAASAVKPTHFDASADQRGWDLRDARGKSARVYAPGSRKRVRREKDWGEKTDNIRAVRNVAVVGALAGTAGTLLYRNRAQNAGKLARDKVVAGVKTGIESGKIVIKRPVRPQNLVKFPSMKQASAIVGVIDFSRGKKPILTKIIDSTKKNVSGPSIEVPGQGAITFINQLPPKKRAGVLRVIGATAVAGGSTLAGMAIKRPKTGALIGGLGAGLLLKR